MRILVLNYEYPPLGGGAGTVTRDLAAGLAAEGHRVDVVTMWYPGLPACEVRDGVRLFRLKCLRTGSRACMPWEQFTYILAAERFLEKRLRRHSYDVIHAHFILPTGEIARQAKQKYGIPYILTAHGSDVKGHNNRPVFRLLHWLAQPLWRRIVKESSAVAVPSAYLMGLAERELDGGNYLLIPNGIDLQAFCTGRKQKEKRLLLMGRMQKSKNFQTVFRAIAMLPEDAWRDWEIDVLGDGPCRSDLEKLCDSLGIRSRVRFRGWITRGSRKQLAYLKRSSVFVSASCFENCPMVVLEAAAAGCRLLLSDIEGHRQIAEGDAGTGFFAPDDAAALAEALREVLGKEPEELFSEHAFLPRYDIRRVTREYADLMAEAASPGLTMI